MRVLTTKYLLLTTFFVAFVLTSSINIGSFTNVKVQSVKIRRSVHSYVETAHIFLPAIGRVVQSGQPPQYPVQIGEQFNVGDPVTIALGYDGDNNAEFSGFIKRVNYSLPVEIECEGFSWLLRKLTFQKTFSSLSLYDLLAYITQGTAITLSNDIAANVNLGKVILQNKDTGGPISGSAILDWLHDEMKQTVYFRNFSQLYAGLQQTPKDATVNYGIGWNTLRNTDLRYHTAASTLIKVTCISGNKNGTHLSASAGDEGGAVALYKFPVGLTQDYLNQYAQEALRPLKYNGYEGKVHALLQPYCEPGDFANITDARYSERDGTYFVESTEIDYSRSGARRVIGIGESITDSNTNSLLA